MIFYSSFFGFIFVISIPALGQAGRLSLDGAQWTVTNSNQSITVPARVPGGIYTDLMLANIIGDPYFRSNDLVYRWVGYDNWTYSRNFQVTEEFLDNQKIVLTCNGLDTVGEVILNGQSLGHVNNMFVRYVFDCKDKLHVGENSVEVRLESPVEYAKRQHIKHLEKYLVPPTCPVPVQNGECHVNFIRKIQSSFSWDWGPSFPSQGIWKPMVLESYSSALIRDLTVFTNLDQTIEGDQWNLDVNVFLERSVASKSGNLEIKLNQWILATQTITFNHATPLNASFSVRIPLPKTIPIELWWPARYGAQKLYNFSATFVDELTTETSVITKRIGFRTIELVQDNITDAGVTGRTFYFRVNGVSIFAKGSNLIPLDSFPERVTPDYIRWLMQSTVDANMNMLRIWGGGMYENELLYDAADELGILLWQDFIFACSLYPVDDDFLQSVATEVTQQIRRLQTHASVCLWSGNNENEAAIAQNWWPQIWRMPEQYKSDYVQLYVKTIRPLVEKEDPTRPFLTSSPTNGLPAEQEGQIDEDPQNELFGDVHFYNYVQDGWDWTIYPRPRFASEYGYQSFPSFKTLAAVSQPGDWTFPKNSFLDHRQHHLMGNVEMQSAIRRQFTFPDTSTGLKGLMDFLYLAQVSQAMSVKTETEHYRRSRSDLIKGKGYTMGALYWQLNDIWQGASWSSIEYLGKWKILHYFAKEFFAPVLVSPYIDGDVIKASVISDLTVPLELTLNITVYDWSSFTSKYQTATAFTQAAQSAKAIFQSAVSDLLNAGQCQSATSCFFYFRLVDSKTKNLMSNNFVLPAKFNQAVGLSRAIIQISNISQIDNRRFVISLESDRIAPFVWLDVSGVLGTFSTNGFLMVEPMVTLNFTSNRDLSLAELTKELSVQSLMDSQGQGEPLLDALSVLLNQE